MCSDRTVRDEASTLSLTGDLHMWMFHIARYDLGLFSRDCSQLYNRIHILGVEHKYQNLYLSSSLLPSGTRRRPQHMCKKCVPQFPGSL